MNNPYQGLFAHLPESSKYGPSSTIAADQAAIAIEKKLFARAYSAALSFDPILAALFKTELEWRAQTRVDGKKVESGRELCAAVIDLAKRLGWEEAA